MKLFTSELKKLWGDYSEIIVFEKIKQKVLAPSATFFSFFPLFDKNNIINQTIPQSKKHPKNFELFRNKTSLRNQWINTLLRSHTKKNTQNSLDCGTKCCRKDLDPPTYSLSFKILYGVSVFSTNFPWRFKILFTVNFEEADESKYT